MRLDHARESSAHDRRAPHQGDRRLLRLRTEWPRLSNFLLQRAAGSVFGHMDGLKDPTGRRYGAAYRHGISPPTILAILRHYGFDASASFTRFYRHAAF